jgi:hypothetical protein
MRAVIEKFKLENPGKDIKVNKIPPITIHWDNNPNVILA